MTYFTLIHWNKYRVFTEHTEKYSYFFYDVVVAISNVNNFCHVKSKPLDARQNVNTKHKKLKLWFLQWSANYNDDIGRSAFLNFSYFLNFSFHRIVVNVELFIFILHCHKSFHPGYLDPEWKLLLSN